MRAKCLLFPLAALLAATPLLSGCGGEAKPSQNEPKGVIAKEIERAKALEGKRADRDQGFEDAAE